MKLANLLQKGKLDTFYHNLDMLRKYDSYNNEFGPKWLELMKELNVTLEPEFRGGYYVPYPRQWQIKQKIYKKYLGKDRHYHNLAHILDCLSEFEEAKHLSENPIQVKSALVWHDEEYDTHRNDNEEKSLEDMKRDLLYLGVGLEFIRGAGKILLATKHDKEPKTIDEKLIMDIDLVCIGKPYEEFRLNGERIRKEYAWVKEEDFRKGRREILQSFLDRTKTSTIYYTDFFRNKYETQAEENLERAIEALR